MLDTDSIRADFPILDQQVNGNPLVYLDNAATSQTPRQVVQCAAEYYGKLNANIHRGAHKLAREATLAHEAARETIARHLNAAHSHEVVFTSGTTDAINLVAQSISRSSRVSEGDTIIVSGMEHHSNIVPWQMLCQFTGAKLKVIPVLDNGTLDLETFTEMLDERVKIVAVNHVSNALGTVNPVQKITELAHQVGAWVLIDGAQSTPHSPIDIQSINCDFYAFSGHKIYGPTGIGILWGREQILEQLPPWRGGGEMIKEVTFEKTTYNDLPYKYEAGTPDIEGGIGLAAAIDYVNAIGLDAIAAHEQHLAEAAREALSQIDGIQFYGTAPERTSVVSFLIDGIHHYDLGSLIDQMGVAVRTGHHCCQPLMARFGITGTVRASFAAYNTPDEVETLVRSVQKAVAMLR